VLDDAGVADGDIIGVQAELPLGPPLAEEIPALVERFLDLAEPLRPCLFERLELVLCPQFVLLGHQPIDALPDLVVVHQTHTMTAWKDGGVGSDPVIVRLVRPEEAEEAGKVVVAAFEAMPGAHMTGGYAEELADVAGRAEVSEVFVAIDDEVVVGCTTLVTDWRSPLAEQVLDGECQIRMMAVAPEMQRRGIGQLLLDAAIERARDPGPATFEALFLHSTPLMTAAHRLYQRNGFVRVPERDWLPLPELTLIAFRLDLSGGG
jgi:ribosomal protein S18 acetylase RimI-like enzyme